MADAAIKFSHNDYEIVDRKILYQGVFRLAEYQIRNRLFKGGWSHVFKREILERHSAVAVLPYDPLLDRIILIEQFRAGALSDPISPWLIEIVAGVFAENEKPEEVALREAKEEADCEVLDLYPVCEFFVSPGGSNEYLHIFCGRVNAKNINGIHGLDQENEDIRVINIPTEEAFDMLRNGKIKTCPAIVALQWLELNRWRLQELWVG